jgi:hypothetical protein
MPYDTLIVMMHLDLKSTAIGALLSAGIFTVTPQTTVNTWDDAQSLEVLVAAAPDPLLRQVGMGTMYQDALDCYNKQIVGFELFALQGSNITLRKHVC